MFAVPLLRENESRLPEILEAAKIFLRSIPLLWYSISRNV